MATESDTASSYAPTTFSEFMPMPIRIIALISAGALAWAANLHLLAVVGIDTAAVLDVRVNQPGDAVALNVVVGGNSEHSTALHLHPSKLYPPVYHLALLYFSWTALGWAVYSVYDSYSDSDNGQTVAIADFIPAAFAVLGVLLFLLPVDRFHRRERQMFLRSLRRIIFGTLLSPVPFCDVILADFLTSYAKVLGDVWIAAGLLVGADTRTSFGGRWGVPLLTLLPYFWRFRQCMAEVCMASSWSAPASSPTHAQPVSVTPRSPRLRSALNAIKYASALPVIVFSALQTQSDLFEESPEALAEAGVWLGPKSLFRLWILAVLVNSLYSFWWDVTNDWGLSLLIPSAWKSPPAFIATHIRRFTADPTQHNYIELNGFASSRKDNLPHSRARSMAASMNGGLRHDSPRGRATSASKTPDEPTYDEDSHPPIGVQNQAKDRNQTRPLTIAIPSHHSAAPFLRPHILLPDPIIYYTVIGVDLLLRLTWSLKLSSHLHSIHEIEQGIFLMEALEVLRRWIWVFVRIEWQAVSRSASNTSAQTPSVHHIPNNFLLPLNNSTRGDSDEKHGLGIRGQEE